MPDVFTKAKRSQVMSRIRGRGNKETEIVLATLLRMNGISGWRRHVQIRGRAAMLRGPNFTTAPQRRPTFRVKPDFIFPKLKLAIFVDGCFWHCCPKHSNVPVNNRLFWEKKLAANKVRDRLVSRTLKRQGWKVIRIWEHDLTKRPDVCVRRIQRVLTINPPRMSVSERHF